jgi:DNA-binding transcriptional MerR regulator
MTIEELAAATGTTTRSIRSFQTMGLLPPPRLQGRTGLYSPRHAERLAAILRLQDAGFALQSLLVLFAAHARGDALGDVLGLDRDSAAFDGLADSDTLAAADPDDSELAELYGFADLQPGRRARRSVTGRLRPLLSVVPTTVWDETEAS